MHQLYFANPPSVGSSSDCARRYARWNRGKTATIRWHYHRNSLLGMGDTVWPPPMTARRNARCATFFGELRQGQYEEHFELGVRRGNGINDVIAMERLGLVLPLQSRWPA